jgi:ATP-binding cassette subfamily F protein uup
LTILEDYLDDFPGAVIVVSHDRYFLDRLVDKIFAFEDHGCIKLYNGGYSDYYENRILPEDEGAKGKRPEGKKSPADEKKKDRPQKLTFKEQREFEQIEDIIAGVEQQIAENNAAINSAGSNFELLQQLVRTQQELEKKLDELLERWTYLNELAESFKG